MLNDIHFEILGVTRQSTREEIKKAYHREIKKWHPDKFQDQPGKIAEAIEKSKQINQAFRLLKNYLPPEKARGSKFNDSKSVSKRSGGRPSFHRVKLKTGKIWSIGYDAFTKILEVDFYEKGVYHFYDVPEAVYTQLMFADPADEFLEKNIATKYRKDRV